VNGSGFLAVVPNFTAVLPPETRGRLPAWAHQELREVVAELLKGHLEILGVERTDLADPDWFFDPVTGRRAPADNYAFAIDHRSEAETGNVKQVWELSRMHHLTLMSAASYAGESECADAIASQLRSWWAANPFLSGINWTSGIEIGVRLISWVWIRRLLDGWHGAVDLFEGNPEALQQIFWHQRYLATFQSRGSSANNHVIAEAAGQLIASLAFPWFKESEKWRDRAARLFEEELRRNTFPSGLNREQASSYHLFVTELGLLAAAEADACGHPLSAETWERLTGMLDAAVALLDEAGRSPRQGDGDDGRALVVDPPGPNQWGSLTATGAALVGPATWWPEVGPSVMSTLVGGLVRDDRQVGVRTNVRVYHFADAGCTLLHRSIDDQPEIWCRCDGGPHGFLSIAAHAHADALSVEVRHGGVDVLADPGTYCYHGEAEWRRYFRSTLAHNTIELAGEDQSLSGGPFLWLRSARTTEVEVSYDAEGRPNSWSASHDGYDRLDPPARHGRRVTLDHDARRIDIIDEINCTGSHLLRMTFHIGPSVDVELDGSFACLKWTAGDAHATAQLDLPEALAWTSHCGERDPILGWYSDSFGRKEPAVTLLGIGYTQPGQTELRSAITFRPLFPQ
jgi:hypothetical protein